MAVINTIRPKDKPIATTIADDEGIMLDGPNGLKFMNWPALSDWLQQRLAQKAEADLPALAAWPTTGQGSLQLYTIKEVVTGSPAGGDLAVSRWILMADNHASDGTTYQRPDDYADSSNEKTWIRIG